MPSVYFNNRLYTRLILTSLIYMVYRKQIFFGRKQTPAANKKPTILYFMYFDTFQIKSYTQGPVWGCITCWTEAKNEKLLIFGIFLFLPFFLHFQCLFSFCLYRKQSFYNHACEGLFPQVINNSHTSLHNQILSDLGCCAEVTMLFGRFY